MGKALSSGGERAGARHAARTLPSGWWDRAPAALLLALFAVLTGAVRGQPGGLPVDDATRAILRAIATPPLDRAMRGIHTVGSEVYLLAPVLIAWQLARHRPRAAALVAVGEGGIFLIYRAIKGLIRRTWPGQPAATARLSDYLFPSGHTVAALVTLGLLAYLLSRHVSRRVGRVLSITLMVAVAAYCFSLIYLGYHYPTDVLGGLLLGGAWLGLLLLALRRIDGTPATLSQGAGAQESAVRR